MRKKINPNLLRQKITQNWTNNFYIQKPYKIENIFIKTFKILYLIRIFLTTFRNLKFFIKNKALKKKIKRLNHNIIEISNYKLLNTIFEKRKKDFLYFCNVVLRNAFYTNLKLNTFDFKTLLFKLTKKLKKNWKKKKKIQNHINFNLQKNTYHLKKIQSKNNIKTKKIHKIIFKPLLKLKKNKICYFFLTKQSNKKLKKTSFYFNFWKKNFRLIKKGVKSQTNLRNIDTFFQKKIKKFQTLTLFIYSQLFKIILENNLRIFFKKQQVQLNNTIIKLQLMQNHPKIKKKLDLIFRKLLLKKPQLKQSIKSFKKLFFLFPSFSVFYLSHLINEQFAFELAKTKKHWKIIKTVELFLIQYLNTTSDFLQKNSQISGMKILITGRPNKSSRTQKIYFKFGLNKQTKIQTINLTKTFYTANAKIGNFGITFLMNL